MCRSFFWRKLSQMPMVSLGIAVVLKTKEHRLANNVLELEQARGQLTCEEN
jgi:hypothetical protein